MRTRTIHEGNAANLIEATFQAMKSAREVDTVEQLYVAGQKFVAFVELMAVTPIQEQRKASRYVSQDGKAMPMLVDVFKLYHQAAIRAADNHAMQVVQRGA